MYLILLHVDMTMKRIKIMLLFSHLYFINCKLPFAGRKSITFFPYLQRGGGGGALIAGKKVIFFPPMFMCASYSMCCFPPMLSKKTKKQLIMKQIMR